MKIAIIIIISLITNLSFAEYTARVPLEINNGGHLSNNSIILNNSENTVENTVNDTDGFLTVNKFFDQI